MSKHFATCSSNKQPNVVSSNFSKTEECLRMLYKCTYISKNSKICYYASSTANEFVNHLKLKHPNEQIYCLYCNRSTDKIKETCPHDELVEHIKCNHRSRLFQCNLCLFRAISIEHVNIHQKLIHSEIFFASINDSKTTKKQCKVLVCSPFEDGLIEEFSTKSSKRYNESLPYLHYYQCYFCSFMNECKNRVLEHCAQKHPDYAIMYHCKTVNNN